MSGDIKIDKENHVSIEGSHLKIKCHDLHLDNPNRNSGEGKKYRRALVHDFDDALVINWHGDYPGGVKIYGEIDCSKSDRFVTKKAFVDKYLSVIGEARFTNPPSVPDLKIRKTVTRTLSTRLGGTDIPMETEDSLLEIIEGLEKTISKLWGKISELESKLG